MAVLRISRWMLRRMRGPLAVGLCFASAMMMSSIAEAGQTRVDATVSAFNFTSAHDYGPWTIADLRLVHAEKHQAINVELSHRSDNDRFMPTHGTYAALGYTADITDRVYAFAQIGFGSALPFASSTEHLELNYKVSRDKSVVLSAAEDWAHYGTGPDSRLTIIGPSFYMRHGVLQARALVQANTGVSTRTGALVSYDYIPTNRDKVTAVAVFGPQRYETVVPGIPIAYSNLTGTTASLTYQRLVSAASGVTIGVTYGHITDLGTASALYTQRGITLGYFIQQ